MHTSCLVRMTSWRLFRLALSVYGRVSCSVKEVFILQDYHLFVNVFYFYLFLEQYVFPWPT